MMPKMPSISGLSVKKPYKLKPLNQRKMLTEKVAGAASMGKFSATGAIKPPVAKMTLKGIK